MYGRVLQAVSRYAGTSVVGTEAIGQTVISVDNVRDFTSSSGFVVINGSVRAYSNVDTVNLTITLSSPLTAALQQGTDLRIYPLSIQRWAFIEPDATDVPSDAVWAQVPHDLAGFLDEDGPRPEGQRELVTYERFAQQLVITDIKDRKATVNAEAIPDGLITETMISPGSITTPLLAANAVATANLQFGAATGEKLSSNAIDGKTITGALVRSAASGSRVELSTQGLKQFKLVGGSEAETMSIGDQNRFTGEIDAVAMIIRDAMQMFGRNNYMSAGSKMTLSTGPTASTAAPTLAWVYDSGPLVDSGWFGSGGHSEPGAAKADHIAVFFQNAEYERADGKRWTFPHITAPDGTSVPEFKPQTMTRIAKADNGAERVVMIGEDYNHYSNGYPKIYLRVYDDSTLLTDGSIAPVLKQEVEVGDFSWFRGFKLGRVVSGSARHQFIIAQYTAPLGGGPKNLTYSTWSWNNNDAQIDLIASVNLGDVLASTENIAGCAYGTKAALGLAGTGTDVVFVGLSNIHNFIFNVTGTPTYEAASEFPTTYNAQDLAWSEGSVQSNTHTCFVAHNFAAGTDMKTYRYANNHKAASETWWATFIWRGEATKTFRTTMSAQASTSYRKMAKLRVTMPSLPAPIAGVGAARDPNNDVYGWEYFIGVSPTEPARTGQWLQSNQPTMVAGTALAVTSVDLGTYPVQSGTNPPASNSFPAVSPASIENASGALKINGDADIWARHITMTGDLTVGTYKQGQWVAPGSISVTNVPCTTNYYKWMRIGNTVTVRAVVTLTGGLSGVPLIDLPFAFATGTLLNDAHVIGYCRSVRSGVAWEIGSIAPQQISGPARATIYVNSGSGAQWNATTPYTWASGDRWAFDITYEAAPY